MALPSGDPFDQIQRQVLGRYLAGPQPGQAAPPPEAGPRRIFEGGPLSDLADFFGQLGLYQLAGVAKAATQKRLARGEPLRSSPGTSRVPPLTLPEIAQAARRGREEAASFIDVAKLAAPQAPPIVQTGLGLAGDILFDPLNVLPPALVGKAVAAPIRAVARRVPAVAKAGERIAQGATAAARAIEERIPGTAIRTGPRRVLEAFRHLEDQSLIEAADDIDRVMGLAKEIARQPRAVQRAISEYVEVGLTEGGRPRPRFTGAAREFVDVQRRVPVGLGPAVARGLGDPTPRVLAPQPTIAFESVSAPISAKRADLLQRLAAQGINPRVVQDLAEAWIRLDADLGQKLVRAGIISPETFQAWEGQHLRRMFQAKEDPQRFLRDLKRVDPERAAEMESTLRNLRILGTGSGRGIPKALLKMRQELDPMTREALGEIVEAAPRVAKGGIEAARAVARKNFFEAVAKHFGLSQFDEAEAARVGLLRMPDTPQWGALAGKWVPRIIHDQLIEAERLGTTDSFFRKAVGAWKFGKVVLNPATHARNILSNILLADFGAELSPARVDIYLEAAKDLLQRGQWYQEARQAGTFLIDTFVEKELPRLIGQFERARGLRGFANALGRIFVEAPARAYQFEEQLFKHAVYIAKRKAGMAPRLAAQEADKWLINYRKVHPWIQRLRSGAAGPLTVPFITFPAKALPLTAEALAKRPNRVLKWFKAQRAVQQLGGPEAEREERILPAWMKNGGWLRLPIEDQYGRSLWLDLTYIFPFGDIGDISNFFGPGAQAGLVSVPFVDFAQDLFRNQSRFTGRPIWAPGATPSQKRQAVADYIGNFLLPPLAGGFSYKNLRDAILQKPDWQGRTRTIEQAMLSSLLGIKIRPIDPRDELAFRVRELQTQMQNLRANLRRTLRDPAIAEARKREIMDEALRTWDRLLQQYAELVGGD